MIPQAHVVRSLLAPSVSHPPSDEQITEFLHFIERLRGRFLHYIDRYAKNRLEPPFLFSGRVNPMTYLASIVERTFRMRDSRRLI